MSEVLDATEVRLWAERVPGGIPALVRALRAVSERRAHFCDEGCLCAMTRRFEPDLVTDLLAILDPPAGRAMPSPSR